MTQLVVNTNTYVTLAQADEYVENHFLSDSTEYLQWFSDTRPERDKIVALVDSAESLNFLLYKGRKAVAGQKLAFPRRSNSMPGMVMLPWAPQAFDGTLLSGSNGSNNGLESAKSAQIVNAVARLALNPRVYAEVQERTAAGIKSRKMSAIAEDYTGTEKRTKALLQGLYAKDKVESILISWIVDSVYSL
jgi:hypothetical protein